MMMMMVVMMMMMKFAPDAKVSFFSVLWSPL